MRIVDQLKLMRGRRPANAEPVKGPELTERLNLLEGDFEQIVRDVVGVTMTKKRPVGGEPERT